MRLIKISVLAGVSLSLFACGGGGSSGGGSNGDGGNTNVLGAQWTNQIGSASGVSGTDNISLEPVSNTIYRLNQNRSTLCTISASANSATPWNCSSVSVMNGFPSGYTIYSQNLVPDGSGNMYTIGMNASSQYFLLKYNGTSWSSVILSNVPSNINFVITYYYNGYIYGLTSSSLGNSNQYNLVAFDPVTGNHNSANTINSVYTGVSVPTSNSSVIMNNTFYVNNVTNIQATSLINTSNVTTYRGETVSSSISATTSNLYACGPISGYTGTGINATSLSNPSGWQNVGYTYSLNVSGYNVYAGCYSMYASTNRVFVVGYVSNSAGNNDAAVFTQ